NDGTLSKQKKYLKQISSKNKLIIVKDSPFKEDLSSDSKISSDDEIM
ncbi:16307_t:CDS:1, partial [Funneliformis mosseae]